MYYLRVQLTFGGAHCDPSEKRFLHGGWRERNKKVAKQDHLRLKYKRVGSQRAQRRINCIRLPCMLLRRYRILRTDLPGTRHQQVAWLYLHSIQLLAGFIHLEVGQVGAPSWVEHRVAC